jgi:CheY-like chemotaxis protein
LRILVVEDEAPKREHICSFIQSGWPGTDIKTAKSVRTGIEEILQGNIDLLILDMSLPTFEVGANESGGRPQNFGGAEIMRYMDLYDIDIPVIVVTAYEAFSRAGRAIDHESLNEQLARDHPRFYKGLIYYNSLFAEWKKDLEVLVTSNLQKSRET